MNTLDICHLLKNVPQFGGVFSSDEIPSYKKEDLPKLLVVNTDPSHEEGTHWIALYLHPKLHLNEYFDSYGYPPVVTSIKKALGKDYIYNDRQLQSFFSDVCGQYCVHYCIQRSNGLSLYSIVCQFTSNLYFNDEIVARHVARNIPLIKSDSRQIQICHKYCNNILRCHFSEKKITQKTDT